MCRCQIHMVLMSFLFVYFQDHKVDFTEQVKITCCMQHRMLLRPVYIYQLIVRLKISSEAVLWKESAGFNQKDFQESIYPAQRRVTISSDQKMYIVLHSSCHELLQMISSHEIQWNLLRSHSKGWTYVDWSAIWLSFCHSSWKFCPATSVLKLWKTKNCH